MKVLLAHNYYQHPGGEDTAFRAEAEVLLARGHRVFSYTEHNDKIPQMNYLRVAAGTIWSQASKRKLSDALSSFRPDVVHFQNTFPLISPAAYYACKEKGIPIVQTLQNYRLLCPSATLQRNGDICEACITRITKLPAIRYACYHDSRGQTAIISAMLSWHTLMRTWSNMVDVYVALTEFARKKFIEGGLPPDRIVVKPNMAYPAPTTRSESGNYALFVGRLSAEKGVLDLLTAWRDLNRVPLKIVGDGPLKNEVEKVVLSSGNGGLELLGWRSAQDVTEIMKGAAFLIFPSRWYEGFPLTIAEAFACGLPVIASKLGAMAEIVEPERTGLHFLPGDTQDLAEKIEWAWSHEREMEAMGLEARREYETKYSAEQNYKSLMNIYQLAIRRSGVTS